MTIPSFFLNWNNWIDMIYDMSFSPLIQDIEKY